jgi:hypothetical protein
MSVIAISDVLDQSMSIMTNSENQDAILYLGTPFDSSDGARKTALIAEGLGFYSKNKFHICVNGESVNGVVGNATLADSRLSVDNAGLVDIPGSLTVKDITTTGSVDATKGLRVSGGGFNQRGFLNLDTGKSYGSELMWGTNNTNNWKIFSYGPALEFWRVVNGELKCFEINAQGYVNFFGGTNAASDRILKDNVEDMPESDAINLLKSISAKTYTRNDMTDNKKRAGFIAQDFETAPITLGENLVGTATHSKEAGGAETEIKTLAYDRVGSPILWTVCKNLLARIEALETKLNSP